MPFPMMRVAVQGDSMLPTLAAGDWLVARRVRSGCRVRSGEVVLLEHPHRAGMLLVKRAVRRTHAGWWVEGDNRVASEDSRLFGVVPDGLVLGRVLCRYHPDPRWLHGP